VGSGARIVQLYQQHRRANPPDVFVALPSPSPSVAVSVSVLNASNASRYARPVETPLEDAPPVAPFAFAAGAALGAGGTLWAVTSRIYDLWYTGALLFRSGSLWFAALCLGAAALVAAPLFNRALRPRLVNGGLALWVVLGAGVLAVAVDPSDPITSFAIGEGTSLWLALALFASFDRDGGTSMRVFFSIAFAILGGLIGVAAFEWLAETTKARYGFRLQPPLILAMGVSGAAFYFLGSFLARRFVRLERAWAGLLTGGAVGCLLALALRAVEFAAGHWS
jgi:hypothetical protein